MSRCIRSLLVLLILCLCAAPGSAQEAQADEAFYTRKYEETAETIKRLGTESPTGIFRDLREFYAGSSYYKKYQSDPLIIPSGVMMGEISPGAELRATARQFIDDNFALTSSHLLYLNVFPEEKYTDQYNIHRMALLRLFNIVRNSGNGLSPETAIKVLVISEEYAFLSVFRYKIQSQVRVAHDGSNFDVFDVFDVRTTNGDRLKLWFNVDPLFTP